MIIAFINISDLCESIAKHMGLTLNPPSVMMVRIGGLKGVLVRDSSTVGITARQSMVKFLMDINSNGPLHDTLCVVHCAQYAPVFLNMEVPSSFISYVIASTHFTTMAI